MSSDSARFLDAACLVKSLGKCLRREVAVNPPQEYNIYIYIHRYAQDIGDRPKLVQYVCCVVLISFERIWINLSYPYMKRIEIA